jgi:hypothetical protein
MYILSPDKEGESGAFAVDDDYGVKVVYLFQEYDDADRYLGLLEAENYPPMKVVEVENQVAIRACEMYNHRYVVIKPDDVVIPPRENVTYRKN